MMSSPQAQRHAPKAPEKEKPGKKGPQKAKAAPKPAKLPQPPKAKAPKAKAAKPKQPAKQSNGGTEYGKAKKIFNQKCLVQSNALCCT